MGNRLAAAALLLAGVALGQYAPPTFPSTPTPIESFGASPSATAATNTAAIQAALNVGGLVTLTNPGTYAVNNTLVIASNTQLRVGPGVTIQEAASINKPILVNSGYNTLGTTTGVTITDSGGTSIFASLAWTAHGLNVGDYFLLSGSNQSGYNGVYLVNTVTDANDISFDLVRLPGASPTGSAKAKKCDINISIEGGTWDYNNNAGTGANGWAMIVGCIANSRLSHLKFLNAAAAGSLSIGASSSLTVDDVSSPSSGGPIVQGYGPMFRTDIRHISGIGLWTSNLTAATVDVQTKDLAANVTSGLGWTFGDVIGCLIDGINYDSNAQIDGGVLVHGSVNEWMSGIHLTNSDGVGGTAGLEVVANYNNTVINDVAIDHVSGSQGTIFRAGTTNTNFNTFNLTIDQVVIRDSAYNPDFNSELPIDITGTNSGGAGTVNSVIQEMTIDGFITNTQVAIAANTPIVQVEGSINHLNFVHLQNAAGMLAVLYDTGSTNDKLLTVDQSVSTGGGTNPFVNFKADSVTPDIVITDSHLSHNVLLKSSIAANLTLVGNLLDTISTAVVQNTAGNNTYNVFTANNQQTGGVTWTNTVAGTPVYLTGFAPQQVGSVASGGTIALTFPIMHVTGTSAVATITAPASFAVTGLGGCVTLIPDGLFTTTTAGNIALATTAVVSKQLIECYDNGTSKWYPSY